MLLYLYKMSNTTTAKNVNGVTGSVTNAVSGVSGYFDNLFNKDDKQPEADAKKAEADAKAKAEADAKAKAEGQDGGRKFRRFRRSGKSMTIPHMITDNGRRVTGVLQTGVNGVGRGLSPFVGIGKSITRVAQRGVDGVSKGIKKTVGGRKSRKQRKGKSRRTRR